MPVLIVILAASFLRLFKRQDNAATQKPKASGRSNENQPSPFHVSAKIEFPPEFIEEYKSSHEQSAASQAENNRTQRRLFWATVAGVLGAVIYAGIALATLRQVQKQTTLTRLGVTSSQRAYVNAGTPALLSGGHFGVVLRNVGTTQTRNGQGRLNLRLTESPLPANFRFVDEPDGKTGKMSLGPSADTTSITNEMVTPEQLELVRIGKAYLYVWGWFSYKDVFFPETPAHITMVCYKIGVTGESPISNKPGVNTLYPPSGCNTHQCSDEECNGEPYEDGQVWHSQAN